MCLAWKRFYRPAEGRLIVVGWWTRASTLRLVDADASISFCPGSNKRETTQVGYVLVRNAPQHKFPKNVKSADIPARFHRQLAK
jgi:hypothetical protein